MAAASSNDTNRYLGKAYGHCLARIHSDLQCPCDSYRIGKRTTEKFQCKSRGHFPVAHEDISHTLLDEQGNFIRELLKLA